VTPPSYSVRFLNAGPAAGTYTYTVPSGYRAVVLFVGHTNFAAATAGMQCKVATKPFFYSELPGTTYNRFSAVRATAYAGEQIEVYLDHQNTYSHVSGFLFVETGQQLEDDVAFTAERLPPWPDPGKEELA